MIGGQLERISRPILGDLAQRIDDGARHALGGWRLIRTLGGKFYKIRPVHSFATQLTSALSS